MAVDEKTIERVSNFLDRDPSIRLNLDRRIISIRALAKYIIKKEKINQSIDSVIIAIHRYDLKNCEYIFDKAREIFSRTTTISTKSRLITISVTKDKELQEKLPLLFSIIQYNRGDVLRVIQADESIKIFIDEKNFEPIKNIFASDKILKIEKNLAEININLPIDAENVPGVLAVSAQELAMHGINVREALSCFPKLLWFVDENDLLAAYRVLYKLWQR